MALLDKQRRSASTVLEAEARHFSLQIVRDEDYRKNLLVYAKARMLAPALEIMLWHYAYGKPPDRLELGTGSAASLDLEGLSKEELAARARALAEEILRDGKPPEDASAAPEPAGVLPFHPKDTPA